MQSTVYKKHPKTPKIFTEGPIGQEDKKKKKKRSPWLDMGKKESK